MSFPIFRLSWDNSVSSPKEAVKIKLHSELLSGGPWWEGLGRSFSSRAELELCAVHEECSLVLGDEDKTNYLVTVKEVTLPVLPAG